VIILPAYNQTSNHGKSLFTDLFTLLFLYPRHQYYRLNVAREDSIDVICTLRSREHINGFFAVFLETDVLGNISTEIFFNISV